MIFFKKLFQFKNTLFLLLLISFLWGLGNHHQVQANENPESKIQLVLLEQPYPMLSPEQLVNFYTQNQLQKTLKLNNSPSYNCFSDHHLNVKIKNAPSNLLGVYVEGGTRPTTDNQLTVVDLKNLAHKTDVNKVYFFYDTTDYCDLVVHFKLNKDIYFAIFNKDWEVPEEWRPWWYSYTEWRDRWYNNKTPNKKGFYLYKYGSQGFRVGIDLEETASVLCVPLYAADEIYEDNSHFTNIKNFVLPTYLGDGIYVDYHSPKLIFKTGNAVGSFFRNLYDFSENIPVIGNIKSGYDLGEGLLQGNQAQIIDGGVSLFVNALTFGFSSLGKQVGKTAFKTISKGVTKNAVKKITQKNITKRVLAKLAQIGLKTEINRLESKLFYDPCKEKLKNILIPSQTITLDVDENTKLNVIIKNPAPYPNFDKGDTVVIVDREGNIIASQWEESK